MAMQFRTFDEAQTWYELRAKITAILEDKATTWQDRGGEVLYLRDAASILTSYLYGVDPENPMNKGKANTYGLS